MKDTYTLRDFVNEINPYGVAFYAFLFGSALICRGMGCKGYAAEPPSFTVENRCPQFTVTNRIPAVKPVAQSVTSARWSWPNGTEASLRTHLMTGHGLSVEQVAGMTFDQLKAFHDADHEGKRPAVSAPVQSNCPGGACPSPQYYVPQRRGLFGFR